MLLLCSRELSRLCLNCWLQQSCGCLPVQVHGNRPRTLLSKPGSGRPATHRFRRLQVMALKLVVVVCCPFMCGCMRAAVQVV